MSRHFPRRQGDNFICEQVGNKPNILSLAPLITYHPPDPTTLGFFFFFFPGKKPDDQNYRGNIRRKLNRSHVIHSWECEDMCFDVHPELPSSPGRPWFPQHPLRW